MRMRVRRIFVFSDRRGHDLEFRNPCLLLNAGVIVKIAISGNQRDKKADDQDKQP